jgi:hypothetical protein
MPNAIQVVFCAILMMGRIKWETRFARMVASLIFDGNLNTEHLIPETRIRSFEFERFFRVSRFK